MLQWRDDITFVVTSSPTNGTVNSSPDEILEDSLLYKPQRDFVGEDTFVYVVKFGSNISKPCKVKVVVGDSNRDREDEEKYNNDKEQDRAERGESNDAYMQSSVDEDDGEYDDALATESQSKSKPRETFARVLGDSTISGETTESGTPRRNKTATAKSTSSTPATVTKGGLFSRWGRKD